MLCSKCGTIPIEGAEFCNKCGMKLTKETPVIFCHKCGAKAIDEAEFCNKCGTKLIIDETPEQ